MFYIILVGVLVGTNLGMSKKRRKKAMDKDKEYVVQFKEGEGVKCEVVEGRDNGHFRMLENV